MLLTLPALLPALPVIYVVGALMWNVTDADNGGPMWPVTLVFVLMFCAVALANVALVRRAWQRFLPRCPAAGPAARPAGKGSARA